MLFFLFISFLSCQFVAPSLPTFPPNNRQICNEFGHNWAAEIRCLRDVINGFPAGNQSEKSRGSRSLTQPPPPEGTPAYGSTPYSYLRQYGRPNYKFSLVKPTPPSCKCEGVEKLEESIEKRLYDVKMRTQHDAMEKIREVEMKLENDLREFQRITTKDIVEINRKIDYIQAPRTHNNDFEYFFINREESWYSASEHCIGYGARLASVSTHLENSLVSKLVPINGTAWIGVNDVQRENSFRNSDGSSAIFFLWAKDQPNNEEHNENCVEIDHNGRWNDKLCLILRPFVCKKKRN